MSYQPFNSGDEWISNKSAAESLQLEFIMVDGEGMEGDVVYR
jgi:hypothetical protein